MKNLSIIILLIFFAAEVNAQWQPSDSSAVGKRKEMENTATYQSKAAYALHAIIMYEVNSAPGTSHTTYIDTVKVGGTMDTITIPGNVWAKVTIKCMSPTDSLEYALGLTTPATFSRLFPNSVFWNSANGSSGAFISGKLSHTTIQKVFIKAYGTTTLIKEYQVEIEAF